MGKKITVNTRYYKLFPSDKYAGYAYEEYQAELNRSAFLVVDVYGLGFHPEDLVPEFRRDSASHEARPALAWLGSAEHEERIVKTALLPALEAARAAGMTVIYLNNSAPTSMLCGTTIKSSCCVTALWPMIFRKSRQSF
jgi:hypothetical protein